MMPLLQQLHMVSICPMYNVLISLVLTGHFSLYESLSSENNKTSKQRALGHAQKGRMTPWQGLQFGHTTLKFLL